MNDQILLLVIVLVILLPILYIKKSMKKGIRCVGCPDSKKCSSCGHDFITDYKKDNG